MNQIALPRMRQRYITIIVSGWLLSSPWVWAGTNANAPALSTLGASGGLNIPSAQLLQHGDIEAQLNNYYDRRYAADVSKGYNLLLGLSLLPYIEFSGRLTEYPNKQPSPPGSIFDPIVIRDLSANIKIQMPKLASWQPDIAVGMTDLGGGAQHFRSSYGVLTQAIGPLQLSGGYGKGPQKLDGLFGGAQWHLGSTGLTLLVEHDGSNAAAGARYTSPDIDLLGGTRAIFSVQRSFGAKSAGADFDRTELAFALQIPMEKHAQPHAATLAEPRLGDQASPLLIPRQTQVPTVLPSFAEPLATTTSAAASYSGQPPLLPLREPAASTEEGQLALLRNVYRQLSQAGLERVALGRDGNDWVIEFENHRYLANEVDALGIVLGVAASQAPQEVQHIRAVMKKAGMALAEISVVAANYRQFLAGGSGATAQGSMHMRTGGQYDASQVTWLYQGNDKSWLRLMLEPQLNSFYATEVGVYDYALGLNKQAIVPLWKGAELSVNHVNRVSESSNLHADNIYSTSRIRPGYQSAALNQLWWLGSRLLNVSSIGGYNYDYVGVQNESTFFVPGRPDVIRLRASRFNGRTDDKPNQNSAQASYRWVTPDPSIWLEAGYNRYISGDRGPFIELKHYFGDVAASVFYRSSARASFAGFALTIPLAPRQGMPPGPIQLSAADSFTLNIATTLAKQGQSNTIDVASAQATAYPYNTTRFLLNQGRFSEDYFRSQFIRMRESYISYSPK